jgi:RimJ/RimL family protein N-acetyltransferase
MSQIPSVPLPGDHDPIMGPRLTLRPVSEADTPDLLRWLSDPAVVEFYGDPPPSIEEARAQYLEADVNPVWRFVIEHEGRGIGEIQYHHQYPGEEYA